MRGEAAKQRWRLRRLSTSATLMPQSTTTIKGSIYLRRIIEHRVHAGIGRRCAADAATTSALVLATVGVIANTVIAVASLVDRNGGGRRLSDWEEEQVLSHGRIFFDYHIKRFTDRKFCRLYRMLNDEFLTVVQHSKTHLRRRLGLVESGRLARCTECS
jgi:hypothetical protein